MIAAMPGLRRALVVVFALGALFAVLDIGVVLASDHVEHPTRDATTTAIVGLSFIGTGVFAWWRRPANRFGLLMSAVGFAWFIAVLTASNGDALFTTAAYLEPLYVAIVVHMVLAFPSGRLQHTRERLIAGAGYVAVLAVRAPFFLLGGDIASADGRRNVATIIDAPGVADAFEYLYLLVGIGLLSASVVVLMRRRSVASAPQRRAQAPMLYTALASVALLGLSSLLGVFGASNRATDAVDLAAFASFVLLPYGFLAGLVRSRYSQAGAVGELVDRLNTTGAHESLRDALAEALDDGSLRLVYWRPSARAYVTFDGRPVELPGPQSGLAVTEVHREGARVGAIIHDVALKEHRGLVRAVAASAALALDNERLEAELRARLQELRTSRTRLVDATMAERRRLERDLHDGAQQRLVALSLQLSLARRRLDDGEGDAAGSLLDSAREELSQALDELRELARGIHPTVLTERGLGPALEALADRAGVPVTLAEMPSQRLPPAIEVAAYFVVAEALTNVVKYAGATGAKVSVTRADGYAVVEIADDGVGGADPDAGTGTGLRGLADRVSALDGRLEVHSPAGAGTLVRARVPCA